MRKEVRCFELMILLFVAVVCGLGCGLDEKEAKLEIVDPEFVIRMDHEDSYVADAKGVIRNTGPQDVKNVVITGYCRSCGEKIVSGQWYVSDYEKMPHQKATINYLPAGGQSSFAFEEIAFFPAQRSKQPPENLPENLEISIESYEIAD